jgi:proteic killer suppression protein
VSRYGVSLIKSFKDRSSESIFLGIRVRGLPDEIQQRARRKLRMLDAATTIEDLLVPPSNRLEKLRGDRRGQHSIRINNQWRICFVWKAGNALDIEIVDYH